MSNKIDIDTSVNIANAVNKALFNKQKRQIEQRATETKESVGDTLHPGVARINEYAKKQLPLNNQGVVLPKEPKKKPVYIRPGQLLPDNCFDADTLKILEKVGEECGMRGKKFAGAQRLSNRKSPRPEEKQAAQDCANEMEQD